MESMVTIEKSYFDTLLRRVQHQALEGSSIPYDKDLAIVRIPKVDHNILLQSAREYAKLRAALFRGGMTPDMLDILVRESNTNEDSSGLVQPPSPLTEASELSSMTYAQSSKPSVNLTITRPGESQPYRYSNRQDHIGSPNMSSGRSRYAGMSGQDDNFEDPVYMSENFTDRNFTDGFNPSSSAGGRRSYMRLEKRSLILANLSDRTTYKDIVSVVRGGTILDVYLRPDRTASVAFADGGAAQAFLDYTKRNDIYINAKRIEVRWAERHFTLPPHVANKIAGGATRNIMIRNVNRTMTEERIREDLDHIHNLQIVDLLFLKHDCVISTNSVHNAMFARTCMMSRVTYKGLQMEWAPDECAGPLPQVQAPSRKENKPPQPKKPATLMNRFGLLEIDGTEDESEDDHRDERFVSNTNTSGYSKGINWAENGIAAT